MPPAVQPNEKPLPFSAQHLKAARLHLMQSSATMKRIVKQVGPFTGRMTPDERSSELRKLSNEQAMLHLTNEGMSNQEAESFLFYTLGRLDVIPLANPIFRQALQSTFELETLPDDQQIESICQTWQPYASIGAWYLTHAFAERKNV